MSMILLLLMSEQLALLSEGWLLQASSSAVSTQLSSTNPYN